MEITAVGQVLSSAAEVLLPETGGRGDSHAFGARAEEDERAAASSGRRARRVGDRELLQQEIRAGGAMGGVERPRDRVDGAAERELQELCGGIRRVRDDEDEAERAAEGGARGGRLLFDFGGGSVCERGGNQAELSSADYAGTSGLFAVGMGEGSEK